MLFWITLIAFILVGAGFIIAYHFDGYKYDTESIQMICIIVFIILAFILTLMIGTICINRTCENAYLQASKVKREMLIYQYENDFYENDNDRGKYELLQDITSWNQDVARKKLLQDNFWVGIFEPHIYDQLDLIDITSSK